MEKIIQELVTVDYTQLKEIWKQEHLVITLAYTPTCGTCHVAKKMLEVIKAAMPTLVITQINLNYHADLANDLQLCQFLAFSFILKGVVQKRSMLLNRYHIYIKK